MRRQPEPLNEESVPDLLSKLRNGTSTQRYHAMNSLQQFDPISATAPAIPILIDLFNMSQDRYERQTAIRTLTRLPHDDGTIDMLIALLEDSDPDVRQMAAEGIPLEEKYLPVFMECIKSPDVRTRQGTVAKFTMMGKGHMLQKEVLPLIVKALNDSDKNVKVSACETIERSYRDVSELGAPLLALLRVETDWYIRTRAAQALIQTGGANADDVPDLVKYLETDLEHSHIKSEAAQVLGQIGEQAKDAVPALLESVETAPEPVVRSYAVQALGRIGKAANSAIPAITRLLKDKNALVDSMRYSRRHETAEALGRIATREDKDVIDALTLALLDSNEAVRRSATSALEKLGLRTSEVEELAARYKGKSLADQLVDEDTSVRKAVMKAILAQSNKKEEIDYSPLIPGLIEILRNDEGNRSYATSILRNAGSAGRSATEALLELLDSPNSSDRRNAMEALVSVAPDDPEAIQRLGERLIQGDTSAASGLAKAGKQGVPHLIAALDSKRTEMIFHTANALQSMGPEAQYAAPALMYLVKHRRSSLGVWATCGTPSGMHAVLAALAAVAPNDEEVLDTIISISEEDDYMNKESAVAALKLIENSERARAAAELGQKQFELYVARSILNHEISKLMLLESRKQNKKDIDLRPIAFEIIVRYATVGLPVNTASWQEVCAEQLQENRISLEEVENEAQRRKVCSE